MKRRTRKRRRDETPHLWVVDRIEDDVVAVEVDGQEIIAVPITRFPASVQEGDVFRVLGDVVTPDPEEAERRLERSRRQVSVRSKNDPGGDITL